MSVDMHDDNGILDTQIEKYGHGIRHLKIIDLETDEVVFDHVIRCTRKEWDEANGLFRDLTEGPGDFTPQEIANEMRYHFISFGEMLAEGIKEFMPFLGHYRGRGDLLCGYFDKNNLALIPWETKDGKENNESKSYGWYRELIKEVETFDKFLTIAEEGHMEWIPKKVLAEDHCKEKLKRKMQLKRGNTSNKYTIEESICRYIKSLDRYRHKGAFKNRNETWRWGIDSSGRIWRGSSTENTMVEYLVPHSSFPAPPDKCKEDTATNEK